MPEVAIVVCVLRLKPLVKVGTELGRQLIEFHHPATYRKTQVTSNNYPLPVLKDKMANFGFQGKNVSFSVCKVWLNLS